MLSYYNNNFIYLDNAASTPLLPVLKEEMNKWHHLAYVNPSSGHKLGRQMMKFIKQCEVDFLKACKIVDAELIWTSGGTEANNLAIFGSLDLPKIEGKSVLCSTTEHASVNSCFDDLGRRGANVSKVKVDENGLLDHRDLAEKLSSDTIFVSISYVQSETGAIQDLTAIRETLDQLAPEAIFHVDAVQALAKFDIPWSQAGIDLLSVSGHKMHGPGSIGALIRRQSFELKPVMLGGGQQNGLRSGSLDPLLIAGFTRSLLEQDNNLFRETACQLKTVLLDGIRKLTDNHGNPVRIKVISGETASPYIVSISLPDYQGAVLMRFLAEEGIMVGTGSACSANSSGPSKTLMAMGLSKEEAFGALRISFGQQNTVKDVESFISVLQGVLKNY